MDEFARDTILFDHYSELLKDHNKEVFEAYLSEDLSLTELSERFGISRQGISDIIKRVRKSLSEYEDKLGLEKRFSRITDQLDRIKTLAVSIGSEESEQIIRAVDEIMGEL